MHPVKSFTFIFFLFFCCTANGQVITTIAGIDTAGYSGDGGPATIAKLNGPFRAQPDGAGNIYIADWNNNRIRKINASGIISTIAGIGSATHSGDGGPATAAEIMNPTSVAVDGTGNIYIADGHGNFGNISWIRKINTAGIITSIAGNGIAGFSGDGGPATAATFKFIQDIAVDASGNIYIADRNNRRIRKINSAGIITTIAGGGTATPGDGGPATSAILGGPSGVAVDGSGNVYIADMNGMNIRKVNTAGIITTIAGTGTMGYGGDGGPATDAAFNNPDGIAVDGSGNVYIGDWHNNRVRKVSTTGIITTIAGNGTLGYSGDGGPATTAQLSSPIGVAVDGSGNIYISDLGNNCIRKVTAYNNGVTAQFNPRSDNVLYIWPQPNSGTFTISISSATAEPAQIIITSILGQKIKEIDTSTNKEVQVQLDAPPGLYFLTTITEQGTKSSKVLVK